MHVLTFLFLLTQFAILGRLPAIAEETVLTLVEASEVPAAVAQTSSRAPNVTVGVGKLESSVPELLITPCAPTTTTKSTTQTTTQSTTKSTNPFTTHSTTVPTTSSSKAHTTDHIILTSRTQIMSASSDHLGKETAGPVSVGSGAEIVIINSNGTANESSTPIVLKAGDEIILSSSETAGNNSAHSTILGGGAEIIITNSDNAENATFTPIILNPGDEIIVASSNGTKTETSTSIVLGNGTEIQIANSETSHSPIILNNGTEVATGHYSDNDELDTSIVMIENETITETTTVSNTEEVPISIGPMTVVISLDSSSYTWARWSAWYCNCLNSSMSRVRGIMDKNTGITLHYDDYQPNHFQREPCSYKVCECSRQEKQCNLKNITCVESDPYTCVLNDITYQEIIDSKHYWKKLQKGVQALYQKIKTFLRQNTNEET